MKIAKLFLRPKCRSPLARSRACFQQKPKNDANEGGGFQPGRRECERFRETASKVTAEWRKFEPDSTTLRWDNTKFRDNGKYAMM